jgi:hypothetical protein
MKRVSQVVRPKYNEHGEVHWKVGIVKSIEGPNSITVQFVGADAGAGTPNCNYVDGFAPTVGDIVHAITAETRGILIIGSTGQGTPVMAARVMDEPAPGPDATSDPVKSGTFITHQNQPNEFTNNWVGQGKGQLGVWAFTGLATAIQNARTGGLIARIEIELTLLSEGPRAALVLIKNNSGEPWMVETVRWSDSLEVGVPTLVALPIGWLDDLGYGLATIGLSNKSTLNPGMFATAASIYITVEPLP